VTTARATLHRLAVPRLTGTAGAAAVLADVRNTLEALGYTTVDQRFTFSAWPARHGVRTIGLVFGAGLALAAVWLAGARPFAALGLLLAIAIAALAFALSAGYLISRLPWLRTGATNLWAVPARTARFLIVAHRDSKSQTIPLGLRIAAATTLLTVFALLLGAALGLIAPSVPALMAAAVLGLAAGTALGCCGVGNDSAGALDNASGLATLLHVAERESPAGDVAFLVTDAEEFGLAGSFAALRERDTLAGVEAVINFDGVDDEGGFFILEGRIPRRGHGLASTIEAAARAQGAQIRRRAVPPGLMLDHVPFLQSGMQALTLMHGGLLSLARVHRPTDNLDRLSGAGIAPTADVTCETLRRLRAAGPSSSNDARVARAGPAV